MGRDAGLKINKKGKITNEMIADIIYQWSGESPASKNGYYGLKKILEKKGYEVEVEEEKSYLEQAREYKYFNKERLLTSAEDIVFKDEVDEVVGLYEKAIEQMQQQIEKMRCCDNCNSDKGFVCKIREKGDACNDYDSWELKQ